MATGSGFVSWALETPLVYDGPSLLGASKLCVGGKGKKTNKLKNIWISYFDGPRPKF